MTGARLWPPGRRRGPTKCPAGLPPTPPSGRADRRCPRRLGVCSSSPTFAAPGRPALGPSHDPGRCHPERHPARHPGGSARYFVPIGRPEAALLTQTAPSRDGFGQLAWPEAVPGHFRCRWDQSHAGPDLHRTGHHESRWPLPAYRQTLRRRQATPTDRKTITGAIPLPAQHRDGRPAASTVDRQSVVASAALVKPNGGASAPLPSTRHSSTPAGLPTKRRPSRHRARLARRFENHPRRLRQTWSSSPHLCTKWCPAERQVPPRSFREAITTATWRDTTASG